MNDPRILRADGVQARQRLLETALRMFAEKGYAKTSVRELAKAAQVNVSAVSYYFGDKAALYRAVFNDPQFNPSIDPAFLEQEDLTLEQGLKAVIFTLAGSL
jgi:AcrR family transcriptional regulator